jgi:hypothetical protein
MDYEMQTRRRMSLPRTLNESYLTTRRNMAHFKEINREFKQMERDASIKFENALLLSKLRSISLGRVRNVPSGSLQAGSWDKSLLPVEEPPTDRKQLFQFSEAKPLAQGPQNNSSTHDQINAWHSELSHKASSFLQQSPI